MIQGGEHSWALVGEHYWGHRETVVYWSRQGYFIRMTGSTREVVSD
ncbi:hypothetical protein FHT44_004963 [Mycolicibacterium sp. BK634]|nr:hypothetical protein [Mycolicibacterium sp. BK634]MBB3752451.1 hypothetical protein [Mycolicibacterium sp. BK634]